MSGNDFRRELYLSGLLVLRGCQQEEKRQANVRQLQAQTQQAAARLESQMQQAVTSEDYSKAAELRDKIAKLKQEEIIELGKLQQEQASITAALSLALESLGLGEAGHAQKMLQEEQRRVEQWRHEQEKQRKEVACVVSC